MVANKTSFFNSNEQNKVAKPYFAKSKLYYAKKVVFPEPVGPVTVVNLFKILSSSKSF